MSIRAGIYVRVSTDEQRDQGFSIDAQLRSLEEYCVKKEYTIVDVYNDAGYSAKNLIRPDMQKLLKDIVEGKLDKLVAIKVDRLTRSSNDGQWLLNHCTEHGVDIELVYEAYDVSTINGEMMYSMSLIFGQRERKEIGARTKRGLEEMVLQKKHPSIVPFGYKRNEETGRLEIDPVNSLYVKEIFELCASGRSLRSIAYEMQEKCFQNFTSVENKIYTIIKNPIYTGTYHFGRTQRKKEEIIIVDNYCEPIIDEDLHSRAMRWLEKNKHPNYGTHVHLFSSLVKCPECGKIMSATMSYKYNKKKEVRRKYFFLKCNNQLCGAKNIYYNVEKLEKKLVRMLNKLANYVFVNDFTVVASHNVENEEIKKLDKAISQVEQKQKRLVELYVNSSIDVQAINQMDESVKQEFDRLREKRDAITNKDAVEVPIEVIKKYQVYEKYDPMKVYPYNLTVVWEALKQSVKKEILNKYILNIEVVRGEDQEIEIRNINFNKEFFREEKNFTEILLQYANDKFCGFEENSIVLTPDNLVEVVGSKRVITQDQLDNNDPETQVLIKKEMKEHMGVGKKGIQVHSYKADVSNNLEIPHLFDDNLYILPD